MRAVRWSDKACSWQTRTTRAATTSARGSRTGFFNLAARMNTSKGGSGGGAASTQRHRAPSLAADIAVMRQREGKQELLMIKRGGRTFHGYLAFPGGFVDYGEDPKHAALRELQEETSLVATDPQLVGVYGDPSRDPRGHTVSIFYYVTVKDFSTMKAGDDAAHADFYDVEELKGLTEKMAFDHAVLFDDLMKFVRRHNIDIPRV